MWYETLLNFVQRLAGTYAEDDEQIKHLNYLTQVINDFKTSRRYWNMIDGERYYIGRHDILGYKRKAIGEGGKLVDLNNLPNARIVDNQYKKMVIQKTNYLVGKPISIQCDNDDYAAMLEHVFNKKFARLLKHVTKDALNCGVGYIYIYYDTDGKFKFKRFNSYQIIPGWHDADHTSLDYAIRFYDTVEYIGSVPSIIEHVEVYNKQGITFYEREGGGMLKPSNPSFQPYFMIDGQSYAWSTIPIVPFKYNEREEPLLNHVKSLQDGINLIESTFENNMLEDPRNSILVLINYDGTDLGEFRRNLAQYGAVKISNYDGSGGDVKTLQVEVNADNYKTILAVLKQSLIENAMGYDAKDDRLTGNPNQMNIQSMYNDIDLDSRDMESEYQASLEQLLWFINVHLYNTGLGDYDDETVNFVFNRNIMINESEIIANCRNSVGLISNETILSKHPWVTNVKDEQERLEKENEMDDYDTAFGNDSSVNGNGMGDIE